MSTIGLAERPIPEVLDFLEHAYLHSKPTPNIAVFIAARESLLKRDVADSDRESLVRALILIARSCFAAATPRDGLLALERAEAVVRDLPDSDLKRQLFNVKGSLYMDMGDFTQSFEAYAHTADLARRLGNRDALARVIANLSALFVDFGAYWDGIKLGEKVLAMHASEPVNCVVIMTALNNMTEACLATHQAERGIELGNRVLLESPREETPHRAHLCMTHILLSRLHLLRGRISAAERELIAARDFEQSTGYPRATLKVAVAAALIDHEKGRLRQAIQSLKELLVRSSTDSAVVKDVLSALVTIYEKEGHPKSALKYLQRLSAMTERVNFDHARKRLAEIGLIDAEPKDSNLTAANLLVTNDFRLQTANLRKRMIDSQVEVLERVAVAAEMRDDVTGMHCYRVGKWANLVALEMGLTSVEADAIEIAARLHDIGKIGIPDELLRKPGKLTVAEYEIMKRHAVLGARLLSRSKTPQIRLAEKVALSHHEHWDGTGYPQGLSREGIPLAGRITAVVDVFDALTHERPYKHAWPVEEALAEIWRLSDSWFDPRIVAAFDRVLAALRQTGADVDDQIEGRLKRSRVMRIREYVVAKTTFNPEDSGTFQFPLNVTH
ncbi:MAG: HD domain-containing protein [Burkholderiales bacterium]|nr:HD domain-containing protein [Burkholderiales bacterium]